MKTATIASAAKKQPPWNETASRKLDAVQAVIDELNEWPDGKDKDRALAQYQTYLDEAERRAFGD